MNAHGFANRVGPDSSRHVDFRGVILGQLTWLELPPPQQAIQPRPRPRRVEAFEHPNMEGKLGDRDEKALAVGVKTESPDRVRRWRKIDGREAPLRAGAHAYGIKLPLLALSGCVPENAVEFAAVLREAIGLEFARGEITFGFAVG